MPSKSESTRTDMRWAARESRRIRFGAGTAGPGRHVAGGKYGRGEDLGPCAVLHWDSPSAGFLVRDRCVQAFDIFRDGTIMNDESPSADSFTVQPLNPRKPLAVV